MLAPMTALPQIRYARSGDVHVAYYTIGEGPPDIVFVPGALSHVGVMWEEPDYRRFFERLASFSRLMVFDKRGMGLSDRVPFGTLEERMDDIRAVMDAVGSERAALVGESEGGPLSMLFAATYPERTQALLLVGAEIKEETTEDWPWGEDTREGFEQFMEGVAERWGQSGAGIRNIVPSVGDDPRPQEWFRRVLVESASPGSAMAYFRTSFEIDVRDIVPTINVPTLVVHRVGDRVCHVENGRYLAEHVPGARYIELEGEDHIAWGEGADEIAAEIQEFLTGMREAATPDRVLATVLFTDIVDSTRRATELGDRSWRDLLERHHTAVRREFDRYRGREIDNAGDGFLASFDGPARAIRCARAATEAVRPLGLELRAGVHTGECERLGDKLGGIAVHIGARVAAQAGPGEVLVSGTVRDLVAGSGIAFEDRGLPELKGVEGEWRLYAVVDRA
jgi:pimeloyl-ACP methyl ester carboxylesterase